jgi:dsDNA-binding SOS-regulon protein
MKKNKSMLEHMRERNAMQNGPGDPKKKYTASDSAQFAQTYGRMQENAKKLKTWLKDNPQVKKKTGNAELISQNTQRSNV